MVGAKGFEPSTSWSRTRRASQAALRPDTTRCFETYGIRAEHKNSTANGSIPETLWEAVAGQQAPAHCANGHSQHSGHLRNEANPLSRRF